MKNSQFDINYGGIGVKKHIWHHSATGGGLEESVESVRASMGEGCDCAESTCFEGLCPEAVYRHRLDIDELTKAEHHMYLLGQSNSILSCHFNVVPSW